MSEAKQKRILILSLAYYPQLIGGAEVAIKEITDRISPDEVVFDMITLRFNSNLEKQEKIGNINVHRIGFVKNNPKQSDLVRFPFYCNKMLFPIFALWKFWRLKRQNDYSGIWAMMSYMGMTTAFIRFFLGKIPFVLTLQEGDNLEQISGRKRIKIFSRFFYNAFKEAKVTQVISNYLANWARKMGSKEVILIPNGVDLKKFNIQDPKLNKIDIRKKYGIGENEKVVITTSRLVSKNGIDILIKAMKFLTDDFRLLIVGEGPLRESLENLAIENEVREKIIFAGFINQEEIPDYLHSADIFCRPSRSEGQGISFLEAMATGLPVVATAVGGIPDFLKDKETGIFAKVDDAEDVARKILILTRDEAIREKIVKNGVQMVKEKYNWLILSEKIKREFINI